MAIDKAFIEQLRDRLSIVDVISRYIPLSRKGKEHWGVCPFHSEKTGSFSVSEEKQFYHCFGCGAHGDIITFTMQHQHMSFIEAVEKLAADAGIEVPKASREERERAEKSHTLYEILAAAAEFYKEALYSPEGRHALEYLKKRGLTDETIANFRLCYAPGGNRLLKRLENRKIPVQDILAAGLARKSERDGALYDYFRDRVLFPITDSRGRIVAFGGRVMDGSEPKYLNSPESIIFSKGRSLYGLAQARTYAIESRQVIATEGYMDTIALHKFGFKNAVAPLGTAITEAQMELLWKLAPEPILCFDSDAAGRKAGVRAALRSLPILQPGKSLKFCLIEGAKDPDEFLHAFGHDRFAAALSASISLSDVLWQYFTAERQVKTPEARAGLADEIAKELSRIKNESVRKFYTDDFNARMRMEFSKIIRAESVAVPKANPENPNEKMILAFSIAYPNMFSKFLESGRKIELSHPVYKKIFAEVAAELSVRPHTRETILRHLEEKGFRPENLLKFEMESLLAKPETAHAIIEEKILSAMRDSLKAELSALNKAMLSAGAAEVEKIRAQIRNIALELEGVDEKLEKLEY